jgi:hypothetical protein
LADLDPCLKPWSAGREEKKIIRISKTSNEESI